MRRSMAIVRIENEPRATTPVSESPQPGDQKPRGLRLSASVGSGTKADLSGARAGMTEVRAAKEEIAPPEREHNRMRTNVRAVIYSGTTFQSTVIRDISLGGVGISGAHGLFPGESVTITLLNGASRSGVVRWWLSGCCGVKFDEPLASDDPFYVTAARRAGANRA